MFRQLKSHTGPTAANIMSQLIEYSFSLLSVKKKSNVIFISHLLSNQHCKANKSLFTIINDKQGNQQMFDFHELND